MITSHEQKISPRMLEQRKVSVALEIKSIDSDGRFAGYASVFDMTDNQQDRVLRGAFAESIKGRLREIKLLWQHDQSEPIGYFTNMFEDAHGLYVEGVLMMSVARAKEAYALLKEGVLSGLSIGYSPLRYSRDAKTGARLLHKVALWEVSLVTFPANEASRVSVVKRTSFSPQSQTSSDSVCSCTSMYTARTSPRSLSTENKNLHALSMELERALAVIS